MDTSNCPQYNINLCQSDEEKSGSKPSRFDKIFVSLSSAFKTEDDVLEAEAIIEEKIRRFIEASDLTPTPL